ncbi:MAG: hypothetical protein ACK5MQ_11785 [Pikeienuella sp.]
MKDSRISAFIVGDRVVIDGVLRGEVMFCAASDSYAPDFQKSVWPPDEYPGIMIRLPDGALVFHDTVDFEDGHLSIEREGA